MVASETRKIRKNIRLGNITLKNFIYLDEKELRLVLRWRNHEKIRKYVSTKPKKISLSEHRKFVRELKRRADKYYFLVKHRKNCLGVVSLLNVDLYNRRCLWGDYANPDNFDTGTGIILEYAALCLAFDVLGLHCLRCETMEENNAALKLHKFFGFKEEGVLRDYIYRDSDSRYFDVVVMSMIKDNWITQQPRIRQALATLVQE